MSRRIRRHRFLRPRHFQWAALVCALLLVMAGTAAAVRAGKASRSAAIALRDANAAEAAGDSRRAADCLGQYAGLVEPDAGIMSRLAVLRDELAETEASSIEAFLTLEAALRADPSREDLRRRVVRRAMRLERYGDARAHLQMLRQAHPEDAALCRLEAECEEHLGRFEEAARMYRMAIRLAPRELDPYRQLAQLLRFHRRQNAAADRVLDQAVKADPRAFQPYYWRGLVRVKAGALEPAESDLARALELAPADQDVLLAWTDTAVRLVDAQVSIDNRQAALRTLDTARGRLEAALASHPRDPRLYTAAADLELRAGRAADAVARLRQGLAQVPDSLELVGKLADALFDLNDSQGAAALVVQLDESGKSAPVVGYLRGRLLIEKREWGPAVKMLQDVRSRLSPGLRAKTDLLVADCYRRLLNPEQELAACRRALRAEPDSLIARCRLADALHRLGRTDEAIAQGRLLNRFSPGFSGERMLEDARFKLASRLIAAQRFLPREEQDWVEVTGLVEELESDVSDPTDAALLRADLLAAQGDLASAEERLAAAPLSAPEDVRVWIARSRLAAGGGEWERSLQILKEARSSLGEKVELRIAEARHWSRRRGGESCQEIAGLLAGFEVFPLPERVRLLSSLAEACERRGGSDRAEQLWALVSQMDPHDLRAPWQRWLLSERRRDPDQMAARASDIRAIEGEGPLWKYAEARRRMCLAQASHAPEWDEARRLLSAARQERPAWPLIPASLGQIEEEQGRPRAALPAYRQAIEHQDPTPRTYRRAASLLCASREYEEAEAVLAGLERRRRMAEVDGLSDLP